MRRSHQFGKITTILIVFVIAFFNISQAQISVETGLSIGFNRHTFDTEDQTGILQPGLALAETFGLPIVIKKDKWELHTGFYSNNLSQSFYFDTPSGNTYGKRSFSSGISTFKVPIHLGRTLQWTDVTSLSPQIGFAWLTSQRTGSVGTGKGSFGVVTGTGEHHTLLEYETQTQAVNQTKFLAEAGLDINFKLFRTFTLVLGTHYSLGLQNIEEVDITYTFNNQSYKGTMISKGTGWKFNIGLTVPLYKQ